MKKMNKLTALLLTGMLLATAGTSLAQRSMGRQGRGMGMQDGPRFQRQCQMIPDLTDEQKEQIKELRIDQMEKMTQFRNKLLEKRVSLRTLQTQDNPNMGAINSTIDEMGKIRTEQQKTRAAHHQEIRKLLTEDQRTFFDARKGCMMRGHRKHPGSKMRRPMRGQGLGWNN